MFQTIVIIGNLGNDPELRYDATGAAMCKFNVAVNGYSKEGKTTTWFRITAFGKQAENANQYLKKGSTCAVQGRMNPDPETGNPRIWNKQDGTPAASYEVTAEKVTFLGKSDKAGEEVPF